MLQLTPVLPKGIPSLYWVLVHLNCPSGIYKDWSFSVPLMVGVLGTHITWLVLEQNTIMWLVNCSIGCHGNHYHDNQMMSFNTDTFYSKLKRLQKWSIQSMLVEHTMNMSLAVNKTSNKFSWIRFMLFMNTSFFCPSFWYILISISAKNFESHSCWTVKRNIKNYVVDFREPGNLFITNATWI